MRDQPILVIDGSPVILDTYRKHLRMQILLNPSLSDQERDAVLPMQLVETLLEDALLSREAQRREITVSEEAISSAIQDQFGGDEIDRQYELLLQATGFSDAEYRELTRNLLAIETLANGLSVPAGVDHVHLRVLLVTDRDAALAVAERLADDADFVAAVRAFSVHDSKDNDGDLGWIPRGLLSPDVDNVAFSIEPRSIAGPLLEWNGWLWLQPLAVQQNRAVRAAHRPPLQENALSYLSRSLRLQANVEWRWNSRQYQWAMDQVHDLRQFAATTNRE